LNEAVAQERFLDLSVGGGARQLVDQAHVGGFL
jgi:hypothetical protein